MVPTPREDPAIRNEWRRYWEDRALENGQVTMRQVAREIAARYHCHPNTVERWIGPGYLERHRATSSEYQRRRYAEAKRKRTYQRNYRRLTRSPELYVGQLFDSRIEADLDTITEDVQQFCEGVPFRASTIANVLRAYEEHSRGPPYIEEVRPGVWRTRDDRGPQ